ncbi:MAG: hypothetical protein IJ127_25535 [Afipia sp.]|jgi:ribosome-binding protein aMBF1 (putative translation factor)|nr:hypothetical protein [Afipia sp.]WIG50693.1 MAG: hypothetical protein OJF48_001610 [Afipia sp.]
MSTSQKQTSWLTKPDGDDKISAGTFGYISARMRARLYDVVVREFKKSGITQATLAKRWGKKPEVVSRFLAKPSNWEIDTWVEALFAINGALPVISTVHVQEKNEGAEAYNVDASPSTGVSSVPAAKSHGWSVIREGSDSASTRAAA